MTQVGLVFERKAELQLTQGQQTRANHWAKAPRPDCFTSDLQWREYLEAVAKDSQRAAPDFCKDCTASYCAKMRRQSRCSLPVFEVWRAGELFGTARSMESSMALVGREKRGTFEIRHNYFIDDKLVTDRYNYSVAYEDGPIKK